MAESAINIIRETLRQQLTGDDKFYRKYIYYFELRLPPLVAAPLGGTSFFFPLVLNPESYTLEEPFAVEVTPTQLGGLYVEENGIIQRTIKLRGHTGFKPRKLARQPIQLLALKPDNKSFSRALPAFQLDLISGHRHFMYLQDAVFRTYADLKRDPATSEDTKLFFHIPKDDEHWEVIPKLFTLERQAKRGPLYHYNIELIVVGKAEDADQDFSEDQSLLEQLNNAIATIQAGINLISAGIRDLTALAGELKGMIKNIDKVIDSVTEIVDAAGDFVTGVVELIQAPFAFLESIHELIEEGLEFYDTLRQAAEDITQIPEMVLQAIRGIQDGLHLLGTHPEVFETPAQRQMREIKNRQSLAKLTTQTALTAAGASTPPQTLQEAGTYGTKLMPGDELRAKATIAAGAEVLQYTSVQQHTVAQGDTLMSLAASFLGDARLWQHIAVINGLKPPFVDKQASANLAATDESPLPGAVGIGRAILIPTFAKPPQQKALLPVLGAEPTEDAEAKLLGTDIALVPSAKDPKLLTFAIDTELGSSDVKKVRGRDNLAQALMLRVSQEKGTDVLYKKVGTQRVVGLGILPVDLETARFRISEALLLDPRIAAIRKLTFLQPEGTSDVIEMDAELEVRGFAEPSTVTTALGNS